ncbi:protein translocase subunit secF [Thermodesulfitimonas autotrophica]|uniref:Protein-export membrane protein SecF n=1 Tax=Thermodesulfitimonas autotrophica TaxID=1894989 RepID=A0A3N5B1M2_9THEO|nr:protein translocase subunit SecF [Thermodesulfitimonas autotrophica]RPF42712.1 protein translocase subunit secF [Thermodesulfitimonas autotrophica]
MRLHFIRLRFIWYALSLLVILPGIISLATRGLNLGIDFTGGSLLDVKFTRAVETREVRQVLADFGLEKSLIQKSGPSSFIIRTRALDENESGKVVAALNSRLGGMTLLRNEKVGPVIGKELTQKAILAVLIASVLMLVYIAIRFEFKQGVAAVAALLHDGLVVLGVFSLFQIEVDSSFVAAVLTILGYSINDTIIIFDRIRENIKTKRVTGPLEDVINVSLWQTMARSINTVLAVLFVLVALYLFGGSTIKNFVLALIVGVSSGCYSSICNASPLWYDLKRLGDKKKAPAGGKVSARARA